MTTTANKDFTKGQRVVRIGEWDRKGTYYYRRAIVHSAGTKRMTLIDANTNEMIGRNFKPKAGGIGFHNGCFYPDGTYPDMTDAEAIALCEKLAAESLERMTENYTRAANDETNDKHYRAAMQRELERLHEPRAINFDTR